MQIDQLRNFFIELQDKICNAIANEGQENVISDDWEKDKKQQLVGNGRTRIIEKGNVIERGGVNFSDVRGESLPSSATVTRAELKGLPFRALGLSLVFHPQNPYVPTVHMNLRFFCAGNVEEFSDQSIWWFGGGLDLTPYYLFETDACHFHKECKKSLDVFSGSYYPKFKKACDEYFYLRHRDETRGIGGIFFDDFNELGFNKSFEMVQHVGNSFLPAYLPIVQRRKNLHWGQREKTFQEYRRGRYVEFNLVYDRGTLFGLQSGGRIESILMSMPPVANWSYAFKPEEGTRESHLYRHLKPFDWINYEKDSSS